MCQILSVTCDNASPNDVMIDALADLVVAFPGAANRTRCFTHILNLVVKAMLRQFDVPKSHAANDAASKALVELAGDIEKEEAEMDDRANDEDDDNGADEWVDPRIGMSQEDQDELDSMVQPVRLVLVKVSSNSAQSLSISVSFSTAAKTCLCPKKLHNQTASTMVSAPRRSCK